jgi:hypothetical protein
LIRVHDSPAPCGMIQGAVMTDSGMVGMGIGAKDVRLERRGERVLEGIVQSGSLIVRKIGGARAGEIATHRFLDNASVTHEAIIATAAERTIKAAAGRRVLAVQDTTEINFSGADRSRRGLGPAGDGKALGFFIHPLLVVDVEEEAVLGVVHARIWTRDAIPTPDQRTRAIEDKESACWIEATAAAGRLLGDAREVMAVADREGDIYAHFARAPAGVGLIVRANADRKLVGGGSLFEAARSFGKGVERQVRVAPRGPGDKGRTANVLVRAGAVEIARPASADARRDRKSLTLGLLEAIEIDPPKGSNPLLWRLLTTLPLDNPADAQEVVRLYRLRWRIEQLFRTMKSDGLKLEDSQLETAERLFKLAALALEAGTRIIQLTDARDGSARPATDVLEETLIEPVAAISATLEGKTERQKNHHPKGSLAWLAWVVARLGGWNCYYKPPGPKTMAAGWQRLAAMLDGFTIAVRCQHV